MNSIDGGADVTNPYQPPDSEPSRVQITPIEVGRPSLATVVFLALLIPGSQMILMQRFAIGLWYLLTIPTAFVVFGPNWGTFIFPTQPEGEYGFYPFVVIAGLIPLASLVHGVLVWKELGQREAE